MRSIHKHKRLHILYYWLFLLCSLLAGCSSKVVETPSLSSLPSPSSENILHLANGFWPPYNGETLPHGGCDSWVIEEAFALQGITVEYEYFPWARAYNLASSGELDGTLSWADTPDHRELFHLSAQPTMTEELVFFYRNDQPFVFTSMEDLSGKTIGVTSGYVYNDAFIELQNDETVTFIENSDDETNIKMLLAGRIDLFPIEKNVGKYLLNTAFSLEEREQIGIASKSFSELDTYLMLVKSVPENRLRMDKFNSGFIQLVKDGRYAQIMEACTAQNPF